MTEALKACDLCGGTGKNAASQLWPDYPPPCRACGGTGRISVTATHPAEEGGVIQALRRLVIAARTSGGTAGPDAGLMDACTEAETALANDTGRFNSDELAVIHKLGEQKELSDQAILRQALRHYQLVCHRLDAGETFSFSGDARRAEEFAGPAHAPLAGMEREPTAEMVDIPREVMDGPYISPDLAEVAGLVAAMHTKWMQREELMRQDGGFDLMERMADLMDGIVDAVPELSRKLIATIAASPCEQPFHLGTGDNGLVRQLEVIEQTWEAHVLANARMNEAIPDVVNGTSAERAVYDERYKAAQEAKREVYRVCQAFAIWAAENQAATQVQSLRRVAAAASPKPEQSAGGEVAACKFADCALGLYRVHWVSGGSSLAAIGMDRDGTRWIAPTNWQQAGTLADVGWGAVERLELLEIEEEPDEPGGFVGDIFFGDPVQTTRGTHRWDGLRWVKLPDETEVLMILLAEARGKLERLSPNAGREAGLREAAAVVDRRRAQISENSTWSRGAIYGLEQAVNAILALIATPPVDVEGQS